MPHVRSPGRPSVDVARALRRAAQPGCVGEARDRRLPRSAGGLEFSAPGPRGRRLDQLCCSEKGEALLVDLARGSRVDGVPAVGRDPRAPERRSRLVRVVCRGSGALTIFPGGLGPESCTTGHRACRWRVIGCSPPFDPNKRAMLADPALGAAAAPGPPAALFQLCSAAPRPPAGPSMGPVVGGQPASPQQPAPPFPRAGGRPIDRQSHGLGRKAKPESACAQSVEQRWPICTTAPCHWVLPPARSPHGEQLA